MRPRSLIAALFRWGRGFTSKGDPKAASAFPLANYQLGKQREGPAVTGPRSVVGKMPQPDQLDYLIDPVE